MSVDTYNNLKVQLARHIGRDDLTDDIDTYIDLCEADLNKRLRLRFQEGFTTASTVSGEDRVTLPDDYLEARGLKITSTSPYTDLSFYGDVGLLDRDYPESGTSKPQGWAVVGQQIYLRPVPNGAYTLRLDYFSRITALASQVQTNWILTNAPDVYLYGSLTHYGLFTGGKDSRLALWQPKFEAEIQKLQQSNRRGNSPRGKSYSRVARATVV